ncbi:kinase-like domain-containing protein [Rhizophagus clarus]|uniref:Kinase-like domain-containing protein n=1 Tax=Rhizophagus clarus TaxID=94130 RepID=A0A8H3M6I2_9GLOM|nr:kinase-like domain-containing protein [Rhizophagus clarus]
MSPSQCERCGEYYDDDLNAEFEWCKPCLFYNIIEVAKGDSSKVNSAICKNGPLSYSYLKKKLTRVSGKKVALKYLLNIQNNTNKFLNEAKTYSVNCSNNILKIYGISQNPHTKDYIMVLHNKYFEKYCKICCSTRIEHNWCNSCNINLIRKKFINCNSGNKEIDDYIRETQLNINNPYNIVFEWIPYDQFGNINEIGKDNTYAVYSAIWKDGPLYYEYMAGWAREPNKKVILKCLQNAINEFFLNEVKTYSINYDDDNLIYGISQNPSTRVYVMIIQDKYHEKCVKNGKIDNFIQEMRANNKPDNINFEFISYNQFNDITYIAEGGFSKVYSAIWKDGPLY